jgi:hypothetical protein
MCPSLIRWGFTNVRPTAGLITNGTCTLTFTHRYCAPQLCANLWLVLRCWALRRGTSHPKPLPHDCVRLKTREKSVQSRILRTRTPCWGSNGLPLLARMENRNLLKETKSHRLSEGWGRVDLRQISAGSDLYSLAPFWLQQRGQNQTGKGRYAQQNQQIASGDCSPEKAGVGGSTPSLATTNLAI